ncbi:TolC family protein [Sediminicoccus sp. BL-A-41-H5]|uniref:TolC family protein n=1 Tax=Sediminicoccus sp. BL-A-41-H5 TaxID=3421106 RepID=UPI003D677A75
MTRFPSSRNWRKARQVAGFLLLAGAWSSTALAEATLSLRSFADSVLQTDETLLMRRSDVGIAAADSRAARGAFEPVGFILGRRDRNYTQNTAQQRDQRAGTTVFNSRVTDFSAGVATRTQTGADIEVAYRLDRYRNNLQPSSLYGREYRSVLGVAITQPLLRGAGRAVNTAPIDIAEHDLRIANESMRQALLQRLMEAVVAYLLVQEATERVRLLQSGVEVAESLLRSAERMTEGGMRGSGAVVEAQAFRDVRRVQLGQARQDLLDARTAMRSLLLGEGITGSALPAATSIGPLEPLVDVTLRVPPQDQLRETAFNLRPEVRIAAMRIARESLRVTIAQNQLLPQLNVTARYDLDGLADSAGNSLDQATRGPYHVWGAGIELRVPLQGNQRARAELDAVRLRQEQMELAGVASRRRIANEVEATRDAALLSITQLDAQRRLLRSQQELLRFAQAQSEGGRLSSIELLRRRLDLFQAEEQLLLRRTAVIRAKYALAFTTGRLAAELQLE